MKQILLALLILYTSCITYLYFFWTTPSWWGAHRGEEEKSILVSNHTCDVKKQMIEVEWESMNPLLHNGQIVEMWKNYYECGNPLKRGDVVYFDSIITNGPVVKKVEILPWDRVDFRDQEMLINHTIFKNSVWEIYSFSPKEQNVIFQYLTDGYVREDTFFIFWDNIKDSIDSRIYGWVSAENFLWKFIIDEK